VHAIFHCCHCLVNTPNAVIVSSTEETLHSGGTRAAFTMLPSALRLSCVCSLSGQPLGATCQWGSALWLS
jgi:hypothetical protein